MTCKDLAAYTSGSDALVLKGGPFASRAIFYLDVLEGEELEGSPIRKERDGNAKGDSCRHVGTTRGLVVDASPFEGLIDGLLEPTESILSFSRQPSLSKCFLCWCCLSEIQHTSQ